MSHPDSCYDPDNSYEDDDMVVEHDPSDILFVEYLYDGHEYVYEDDMYNDSMDGDFDSAMESMGWGLDEQYDPSYDSDYGDW
jgi:hypothetical protein